MVPELGCRHANSSGTRVNSHLMRSFLMGTLLVATVWANEEPTSRCEAWGYGREDLLECYDSIGEMVDNPSHVCWAELSERPTCCGYCGPWKRNEWVDTCRNLDIIRVTPGCGYEIEANGRRYTYDGDKNFCHEGEVGCDTIRRIRVFATWTPTPPPAPRRSYGGVGKTLPARLDLGASFSSSKVLPSARRDQLAAAECMLAMRPRAARRDACLRRERRRAGVHRVRFPRRLQLLWYERRGPQPEVLHVDWTHSDSDGSRVRLRLGQRRAPGTFALGSGEPNDWRTRAARRTAGNHLVGAPCDAPFCMCERPQRAAAAAAGATAVLAAAPSPTDDERVAHQPSRHPRTQPKRFRPHVDPCRRCASPLAPSPSLASILGWQAGGRAGHQRWRRDDRSARAAPSVSCLLPGTTCDPTRPSSSPSSGVSHNRYRRASLAPPRLELTEVKEEEEAA